MAPLNLLYSNDRPGEHASSYYAASANRLEEFAALHGDTRTEVCIIGAGFTGLSAALHLAEAGMEVVLLDAHRAGWGASGRNGGQVGSGQRLGQGDLERMVGKNDARALWQVAQDGKALLKSLIERHGIDCDFKPGNLHALHRERFIDGARAYVERLQRDYDYEHIRFLERDEVSAMVGSNDYCAGTLDADGGHLHPLNFALGLAKAAVGAGVRLHEMTEVMSYSARTVPPAQRTSHGLPAL